MGRVKAGKDNPANNPRRGILKYDPKSIFYTLIIFKFFRVFPVGIFRGGKFAGNVFHRWRSAILDV